MKKKVVLITVILVAVIFIMPGYGDFVEMTSELIEESTTIDLSGKGNRRFTMVIDCGHGGMDGGAETAAGVKEKNINLAIGHFLRDEATRYGARVVMTREEDICLMEEEGGSISNMKIRDIHERKRIIDEEKPDITVSIHLNSYKQDGSVRGAQTFYPGEKSLAQPSAPNNSSAPNNPSAISHDLAEKIQKAIEKNIDYGRSRVPMEKNDIYILKNIYSPIVLVECGFLSNYEDAFIVQNPVFQQKLAVSIMEAIGEYFNLQPQKKLTVIDSRS